jgi:hypothetical protein
MDPGFLASLAHMTSPPLTGVAKDVYPSLLGSLQYAAVCTRPDVSTALSMSPRLINYKSKQHTCVAQSTCEAEYCSAADATKEGLHLRQLMEEITNSPITETTTIWEDNQSAIAYSQNALVIEKTKHIGMKWHFLKDYVEKGIIKLRYLLTD